MLAGQPYPAEPDLERKREIILAHYDDLLDHYGIWLGVRNARKHLGWYLETLLDTKAQIGLWRSRLCQEEDPQRVKAHIEHLFSELETDGYECASWAI
jgi:tRNA-dihydrouridine synthase